MGVTLKSSDDETRSGFPSESQPMEPMQSTTGFASSVFGKREDSGESEGDRESVHEVKDDDDEEEEDSDSHSLAYNSSEEEEEEEESEDSDAYWDKDSFDGQEYNSSDYDGDYEDKELEQMCRCYYRTVIGSKGFFDESDGFPPCIWGGFGRVQDLDDEIQALGGITVLQFLINLATECIEKYNKTKKKNVKFHQFLRSNRKGGSMVKYYITFLARESDSTDDPLVEYQAKAGRRGGKTYLMLCRPSLP